jgi:hypothetical protein
VVGFCERGNERSGSTTGTEFVEQLSDFKLIKDAAPHPGSNV